MGQSDAFYFMIPRNDLLSCISDQSICRAQSTFLRSTSKSACSPSSMQVRNAPAQCPFAFEYFLKLLPVLPAEAWDPRLSYPASQYLLHPNCVQYFSSHWCQVSCSWNRAFSSIDQFAQGQLIRCGSLHYACRPWSWAAFHFTLLQSWRLLDLFQ